MDPVGPWSYTYNRLAAGAAAGATSGDFHHHLATAAANNAASVGAPATTSQLLAQAAHTTSLGSSATSAYPGGFLSPPTVGYDAVFTPFLHHPNPKPAHYSSTINAQHRQALAQDAAPAAAHHQPQSSAFFEQASSGGAASGSATATTWQGGGNQLPSPFGILPHENVPSSGGTGKSPAASTNPAASVYDNFNAHIAAQSLYHINSQLAANAAVAAANKVAAAAAIVRSASPQVTASTAVPANKLTTATNFYQTPTGYAERPSYPSVISQQKQQQQQPTSNSDYSTNTGGKRSGAPGCQQQQQQQIVANAMQTSMTSAAAAGGHQEEQNIAKSIAEKKYNLPKGVGSGFMGSYLKFLQGERDTSPPPASRGGRKATWSRTAAAAASSTAATTTTTTTSSNKSQSSSYNAQQQQQISNGVNIHSQQIIQPPHQAVDVPPDERYYQTTVAARNNSKRKYDDDDERTRKGVKADKGGTADGKDGGKKTRGVQQQAAPQQTLQTLQPTPVVQAATGPPHLPLHPHPHHHHPQPPPQMMQQSYYQQPDEVPQRREMSHRKAKGRSVLQLLNMSLNNEDFAGAASDDEPAEFQDSDTDPVWTPEVDDEDEEWEQGRRKLKKTRDVRNKSRKMSQGGVEEEPQMRDFLPMKDNVQEEVVSLDMEQQMPKDTVIQMQEKSNGQKAQMPEMQGNQEGFKIGQFIVNIQDEITHEWPKLWRVDGKNLLEKYEPILKAGKIVYRNESVFAALLPESYGNYRLVKVNSLHTPTDFRNRQNSLMEWVRDGTPSSPMKEQSTSHQGVIRENPAQNVTPLVDLGPEVLAATPILTPFERLMQEKLVYQEHFEIYIQTLISQALDPNFLTEIIQENDEYFLGSVRAIDSLVEGLRTRLLTARPISRNFHSALEMWPQYEVMQLGANYPPQMACTSCLRAVASVHIRFSGQLYNSVTMTARDFQTGVTYERDFTLCGQCNENLRMHHRMKHQKYTLYMACTQKVQERSGQDPTKTSTTILNELLAEDSWLEELFKNVRQSWVELELLVDPQGTTRY